MVKRLFLWVFLCFYLLLVLTPDAWANPGMILHGLGRTLFSVVEIPRAIIEHSQRIIFPAGVVTGTVAGTFRTVTGTVGGVMEMAQGAAPYAKYMVFFL